MKRGLFFVFSILLPAPLLAQHPRFVFVSIDAEPHISREHPDAKDIRKGFEGGTVIKQGGEYHGFFTERVSKPLTLLTRLGYWKSEDGRSWSRIRALYTSSGNPDGTDPRATLFAPMPVYSEVDDVWSIFYVAYIFQRWPARGYTHQYGRIWRGESQVRGKEGIGGPYRDTGIILQPDGEMQPWEGMQGVDSFFPYRVGNKWYGFYGSANTEVMPQEPCHSWNVGLAEAPSLSGPWKRLEAGNPVNKEYMIENPIVYRVRRWYVTISDVLPHGLCAIHVSSDGVNWQASQVVEELDNMPVWTDGEARTPLSLIDEGDGTFSCYFTGYRDYNGFASVGRFTLKLED